MQDDDPSLIRWRAVTHYRTENGTVYAEHHFEELEQLQVYIDSGPHWDTIEKIDVLRMNHTIDVELTAERAVQLKVRGDKRADRIAAVRAQISNRSKGD